MSDEQQITKTIPVYQGGVEVPHPEALLEPGLPIGGLPHTPRKQIAVFEDSREADISVDSAATPPQVYIDARGKQHNSETGQFTIAGHGDTRFEPEVQPHELIEQMKEDELINKWAEALNQGDRVTSINIEDEIFRRVVDSPNLSDERKEQILKSYQSMAESRRLKISDNPTDFINDSTPTEPLQPEAVAVTAEKMFDIPAETASETMGIGVDQVSPEVKEENQAETTTLVEKAAEADPTTESKTERSFPAPYSELAYASSEPKTDTPVEVDSTKSKNIVDASENIDDAKKTPERDKTVDELQQSVDRIRGMINGLRVHELNAELDKIQQELEHLKNTKTNEKDKKVNPIGELNTTPETSSQEERLAYLDSINNYAKAKIDAEALFAGGEKRAALETAREALTEAREKWLISEINLVRDANRTPEDLQEFALSVLTEMSKKVDAMMLAERTERHQHLGIVTSWLEKNSWSGIGIGPGLHAAGIVETATYIAP